MLLSQAQEAGERECMEVATMLSEVDRRIAETKKDMYEFKRDVIGEYGAQYFSVLHAFFTFDPTVYHFGALPPQHHSAFMA